MGKIMKVIKRVASAVAQPTIPIAPAGPAPLVFNNPERAARIEGSLKNAAFGGGDIRSILEQFLKANYLAEGGRVSYAEGGSAAGLAIKLNRPVQSGDPLGSYYDDGKGPLTPGFLNDSYGPVNSITGLRSMAMDRTQPVERKMGLFAYPDGSYLGENMPNPIQQQSQQMSPLEFNNPERARRIESSLQNANFAGNDIRDILEQLLKANYLAAGGRVGYEMGGDVMNSYGDTIKYNPNLGQFVNSTNQQPVDQTQLLQWSAQNPEPLKTQNQTDPALLAQLIQTLKS
jgi:hypothetical protein